MKYIESDKKFYVDIMKIAFPVAIQSMITHGVNLVDNIMLGQLGEVAMSGASLGNQFIALFTFACMGIGMGSSVMTARFWGARDLGSLKKTVSLALQVGFLFALIFTVTDFFFSDQIMRLFTPDEAVIREGISYLRWSVSTFFLMTLSTILMNILRSIGYSYLPFLASICAFGINIGANYILIFGKYGFPEMGVAGAALGTVTARIVETGIIAGFFFFKEKTICFRLKDLFARCDDMVQEYFRIAMPVLFSDGLLGVGESALAIIMGHIDTAFVSANTITMIVQRISTIFVTGLGSAACFIVGKTLGEKRIDAARRQGVTFLVIGTAVGILGSVLIQFIRDPIIVAYNISQETKQIASELMNGISIVIIFRSANCILTKGVLRGGGDTRFLVVADISAMWLVAVPFGALAGLVWKLPAFWIFLFLYSDQIIKAVWCTFRLASNKWIKTIRSSTSKSL